MNESCQICGAMCEGEICDDCAYRMDSGDNSDIWIRVRLHKNTEYERDQVKIALCRHFEISGWEGTGRKEPNITAKQLFIYALLTRFKMRIVNICKLTGLKNCDVCYIRTKWNKKFRCEITRKKFEPLINAK